MILRALGALALLFSLVAFAPETEVGDQDLGHGYFRRGEHIHFEGDGESGPENTRIDAPSRRDIEGFSRALGRPLNICKSPDVVSFEALSEEYTRDESRVYYKWISPGRFLVIELTGADAATFRAINFTHAVDKNTVWYMDRSIPGSDPETLQLLDSRVVKDSQHVYISGMPQSHLDAATFRRVGSAYYVDANGAYWGSTTVVGVDLPTFRVLGSSFVAVDQNCVYRSGKPLPHLDPATCKLILHDDYGYQVLSDKNGVYLNRLKFLHADPENFEMIDERIGRGGKHLFLVDVYHCTPVTLYLEKSQLIAETIFYERPSTRPLARIRAVVMKQELKEVTISPTPGETSAGTVPEWQITVFQREAWVEQMNQAGKLLRKQANPVPHPGGER